MHGAHQEHQVLCEQVSLQLIPELRFPSAAMLPASVPVERTHLPINQLDPDRLLRIRRLVLAVVVEVERDLLQQSDLTLILLGIEQAVLLLHL